MNYQELAQKYEDNTVLRVFVNLIPYVGGSLDVALINRWSQIRQQRFKDLLEAIGAELKDIQESAIKKDYLESEEFYDLVCQIVNNALSNRCPETRKAYAKVVRFSVLNEETTANLEDIIRQIEVVREKDIFFLRVVKSILSSGQDLTGDFLSIVVARESCSYDSLECERVLYRFENLGLLDHPRNILVKPGSMVFKKLPLFDKLVSYLGL